MLILHASNLANARIAHGFFGRTGGVSGGIFASLNCGPGSGDSRQSVLENRRRVARALSGDGEMAVATLYQVHSPNAVIVSEAWDMGQGPQADAMVTDRQGVALGILTADCAPVLMTDADAGVIGAAHAGWKGAFGGVAESAVAAMEQLGARRTRIAAAIGPCIGQTNYEVGPEFHGRFLESDAANGQFFKPGDRTDYWRFDLEGYVVHRLEAAGVKNVATLSACTYARQEDFFSFRRATHRGETDYGRQISAIMLR